jgi:truncated hemoglobin YjbI
MTNQRESTAIIEEQMAQNIYNAANELRASDEELKTESVIRSYQDVLPLPDKRTDHAEPNSSNYLSEDELTHEFQFVPLRMDGRTHVVSEGSKRLIEEEVPLDDLEQLTQFFYDNAFLDKTLDQFIRSHGDPHAERFARWIHQKLSGSSVWDDERRQRSKKPVRLAEGIRHVVHDRSSAHAAAWYSPKRPSEDVGRHFKLDECRVWMRLHFWALRASGMMEKSPSFVDYYVRFIAHFVRVYESTAPNFARESFRWSEDPKNIEAYIVNGRRMDDVLGLSLEAARAQLPESEAYDTVYPYNQTHM